MKRKKPNPRYFAAWVDEHLEFRETSTWRARALFNHWSDYAKRFDAEPGTPRSFSNELRKLGFESKRSLPGRSRWHHGLRLNYEKRIEFSEAVASRMDPEIREVAEFNMWFERWRRYNLGDRR